MSIISASSFEWFTELTPSGGALGFDSARKAYPSESARLRSSFTASSRIACLCFSVISSRKRKRTISWHNPRIPKHLYIYIFIYQGSGPALLLKRFTILLSTKQLHGPLWGKGLQRFSSKLLFQNSSTVRLKLFELLVKSSNRAAIMSGFMTL